MDHEARTTTTAGSNDRQAEIVCKNVETVKSMQDRIVEAESPFDHAADAITKFAGSTWFVAIHAVGFTLWIVGGSGIVPGLGLSDVDPYPFSLLTLIVSLEAIFLSTFVLISQNQLAAAADRRADLDLNINLLAEQKAAKTLELLGQITEKLNSMASELPIEQNDDLEALKQSPAAADIVDIIDATEDENKT